MQQESNQVCISFDFRSLTVAKRTPTGDGFNVTEYEIADENELWTDWVVVRVQFGHSFDSEINNTSVPFKEAFQNALKNLRDQVITTNPPVFNVEDTEINFYKGGIVNGTPANSSVGDVLLNLESNHDSKKVRERHSPDVLNLDTFLNLTCDTKAEEGNEINQI